MSQFWPKSRSAVAAGWLLWCGIALVGIPIAWSAVVARLLAYGLSARPHWALIAAALLVALAALSSWLSSAPRPRPRALTIAFFVMWCLVHTACWHWQASSLSEPGIVVTYLASTMMSGCCAVIWFVKTTRLGRAKLFVISFAPLATAAVMAESRGLDGGGRPIVCWRFELVANVAAASAIDRAAMPANDLSATTIRDYPGFRGTRGCGEVDGVKLLTDWSASSPRLLWRHAIGNGWGGFAVVGPWAYTQEQRGADECVVCYEAATGSERWIHADRVRFASPGVGDGPRGTPSVRNGRVYSLGATGLLNCLDALTGHVYWRVDVLAEHRAGNLQYGLSGSPLVIDDLVIVSVGGHGHSLVAYDSRTGRCVWHAGDDQAGYGSPFACTLGGRKQIVILNRPGLAAHDPATGEVLWTFPWTNDTETNCSQPLPVGDERLLVSTGYGKGCALLRVHKTSDRWSAEPIWTSRNLKSKFSSAVVRGGHAFGLDDGVLTCIDLADGSRRWKAGRYGHGQVLLVGDVLLVQCETGQVAVVAADPDAHRELARCDALAEKTWNYPALAGRLLLVRNDGEAACFELATY